MHRGPHILLLGCGNWGKLILRDLKALGARVTVLARSESSISRAKEFGADQIVSNQAEIVSDLKGVVVATPSDTHAAVIKSALGWGVPIFVEKPLASNLSDALEIERIADDKVFVMDKWRYHNGVRRLKEIVDKGSLGRPIGLRTIRTGWSMSHNEVDPVWNLLPHDLSICLHLFGELPELVSAIKDPLGQASGGLIAHLKVRNTCPIVVEVSAHHPERRRSVIMACESGVAALADGYSDHLLVRRGPPGERQAHEEKWSFQEAMPLEAELKTFLDFLDGGPPPISSAAEGASVVRLITEIRAAARQSK